VWRVLWFVVKAKSLHFADQLGIVGFTASNGWIQKALKRGGKLSIRLHGEADDMTPEVRHQTIDEWKKKEFHPLIDQFDIPAARIYNADQTGLFFQKLPNRIYVNKSIKDDYAGAKQMKDKNRITLMVCTAADGTKVPLSIIGKAKKPVCFRLCENQQPPMAYRNQVKAWFDKRVTLWWIESVFIPYHKHKYGVSHCILLLDNCPGHKIDLALMPNWCHVLFLPPNLTSNFQPADMGMIASLKIGYKASMLRKLLNEEKEGIHSA
jgi:DDE superfamily endonuclease